MILAKAFCLVDKLNLSSLTRTYLKKHFDSDEEVIQCGRSVAYEDNLPKWKAELVSALNQAGFIRPETDFVMSFRVRDVYMAVFLRRRESLADYLYKFSSDEYENFVGISDDDLESVKLSLRDRLSDKEYEVLSRRFGLDYEVCQSLDYVGRSLGVTAEYARQLEARAIRKLRLRNNLPVINFVASKELNEAIVEFADLQKNRMGGLAELNLTVGAYNALRRAGIDTISDVVNRPQESWSGLRGIGPFEVAEINDKMKKIGYDFSIGH
ncbi:hypothetical protein IKG64_02160 [Candidatus Saccharibacteria bacterium]|nr:hypothetical protein [Candidatus Saccharibacteria bacterium]